MISLFLSQAVSVQIDELRNIYSQAWDDYTFLTHAMHDPMSHDRSYRLALQIQAGDLPSNGSESDRSNPSIAQVPFSGRPPCGPSRISSGDQTPAPSDAEGSPSRHRHWE